MYIRILGGIQNTHGSFRAGKVVEWPDADARPLVDSGAAEKLTADEYAAAIATPAEDEAEDEAPAGKGKRAR